MRLKAPHLKCWRGPTLRRYSTRPARPQHIEDETHYPPLGASLVSLAACRAGRETATRRRRGPTWAGRTPVFELARPILLMPWHMKQQSGFRSLVFCRFPSSRRTASLPRIARRIARQAAAQAGARRVRVAVTRSSAEVGGVRSSNTSAGPPSRAFSGWQRVQRQQQPPPSSAKSPMRLPFSRRGRMRCLSAVVLIPAPWKATQLCFVSHP
mmetsp:Transcript_17378/g.65784  ORF Transcript_17378/g.65784 Transcript_17378/m.65784 type:complete len:211 (+) Transcript_17378:573-1205(+)